MKHQRSVAAVATIRIAFVAAVLGSLGAWQRLAAQQPLETETARLPRRHALVVSGTYEFQTSGQGTEHDVPLALEYGLTDRLTLLAEPVLLTAIRPEGSPNATGLGDIEVTLQFLAREEGRAMPALALAAEEKFPTATNRQIGSGRADFTPYLIASKRLGHFDVHANVGYSFMGRPAGLVVQNTLNVALAIEDHLTSRVDLMAEALSTTAAALGGGGESSLNAPEIAGAEQVGMVGVRYRRGPYTWLSLGLTYDNTQALLLRPGITLELP
jgi:hypothetical protein